MDSKDSLNTFKDILLELMVANETLEKIEKNTASLLPFLSDVVRNDNEQKSSSDSSLSDVKVINPDPIKVDVIKPDPVEVKIVNPDPVKIDVAKTDSISVNVENPDPIKVDVIKPDPVKLEKLEKPEAEESSSNSCCEEILKCVVNANYSLQLLAEEAIFAGGILVQIRNSISGMYELMAESRRSESISRLQAKEDKIESSKEIAKGAKIEYKEKPKQAKLSTLETIVALAGMLTGFVTGVITQLTKIVWTAIKVLGAPLMTLLKKIPLAEIIAGIGRKFRAFARLTELKIAPIVTSISKWFSSIKLAGKMMLAAKFGKYLDPLIKAFDEIKLGARALYRLKIGDGIAKIATGLRTWAKPFATAFIDFGKELVGVGSKISKLKPSTLYLKLLRSVEGLATATDPISTLIKNFARRLLSIPGRIMQWFKGLGMLFKVGKVIGTAFAKLTAPLTVVMALWDTLTGAIDGFKKTSGNIFDKLVGAFKGGLKGLLNGLVGNVLDLLKSLVSWVAGKLGFKNVEKFLDSFSFVDLISKSIDTIVDTGKAILAPFLKFLPKILTGVAQLGETFSIFKIFPKFFNLFAKAIGKLAYPITIALSAYDAITGFMEGYKKGGVIEGLKTGLIKMLDGMFGMFFNIPIKLMQWIYTKLGWDDAAKSLEGVTFKVFLTKLVDWGESFFMKIFEWLGSITKTLMQAVLPKSVQKMLGIAEVETTGPEARKQAGTYRKPEMLDNAAKMLTDTSISQERKDDLTKNLKANYGFTDEEIKAATAKAKSAPGSIASPQQVTTVPTVDRIVSPQKTVETSNLSGATITQYQTQTNELAAAASTPTIVPTGGGKGTTVNNSTSNTVTYNNTNIPDRTQGYMMPSIALGF